MRCRLLDEGREETDDVRSCEEDKVSLVEFNVVAMEPLEAIVGMGIGWRARTGKGKILKKERETFACLWNVRRGVSLASERDPRKPSAQRLRRNDWLTPRKLVRKLCRSKIAVH